MNKLIAIGVTFFLAGTVFAMEQNNTTEPVKVADQKQIVMCTMQYDPVCGQVDTGVPCSTEPCPTIDTTTFSNNCVAQGQGVKILYTGECTAENNEIWKKEEARRNLIDNLIYAKNQKEREEILKDAKAESAPVETTLIQEDERLKMQKRQEVISRKSEEIFSKFDSFTMRLDTILARVEAKLTDEDVEAKETFNQIKVEMYLVKEIKAEAWVIFTEITQSTDREEVKKQIEEVQILLNESKSKIRKVSSDIKKVIFSLKK